MKKRLKISLMLVGMTVGPTRVEVFNDWFDAADFIKQQNLAGFQVTIAEWEYV